jgi:hypothetical protein
MPLTRVLIILVFRSRSFLQTPGGLTYPEPPTSDVSQHLRNIFLSSRVIPGARTFVKVYILEFRTTPPVHSRYEQSFGYFPVSFLESRQTLGPVLYCGGTRLLPPWLLKLPPPLQEWRNLATSRISKKPSTIYFEGQFLNHSKRSLARESNLHPTVFARTPRRLCQRLPSN